MFKGLFTPIPFYKIIDNKFVNFITRLLEESMTGDLGKFSSKKLSMASCLFVAEFMALYNLLVLGVFDINIFNSLLLAGLGLSGLSITDKKLNDNEPLPEPDKTTTTTNLTIEKTETEKE